jgi:hypothetical protein
LEVENIAHTPGLSGSAGNFVFTPKIGSDTTLWAGDSSMEFNFGNINFGVWSVC